MQIQSAHLLFGEKKCKLQATVQSSGTLLKKGKRKDESGNIKGRKEAMKQRPEVTGEG